MINNYGTYFFFTVQNRFTKSRNEAMDGVALVFFKILVFLVTKNEIWKWSLFLVEYPNWCPIPFPQNLEWHKRASPTFTLHWLTPPNMNSKIIIHIGYLMVLCYFPEPLDKKKHCFRSWDIKNFKPTNQELIKVPKVLSEHVFKTLRTEKNSSLMYSIQYTNSLVRQSVGYASVMLRHLYMCNGFVIFYHIPLFWWPSNL